MIKLVKITKPLHTNILSFNADITIKLKEKKLESASAFGLA